MQTDYKQIYQELSQKTGKPESLYKDIGTFMFQETARMMKTPETLIIKLKGVGNWHLRKKRMDIVVNEWTDRSEVKGRDQFTSDYAYDEYTEKHRRYIIFQERLKDYDRYIALRRQIREERLKHKVKTIPKSDEESGKFKSE